MAGFTSFLDYSYGKINLAVASLACLCKKRPIAKKNWSVVATPVPLYRVGMKAKPLFNVDLEKNISTTSPIQKKLSNSKDLVL